MKFKMPVNIQNFQIQNLQFEPEQFWPYQKYNFSGKYIEVIWNENLNSVVVLKKFPNRGSVKNGETRMNIFFRLSSLWR